MRLNHIIYIGLLLGLSALRGSASQIAPTDSVHTLDEYVVTGTIAPRTLKSIPIMTQLITSQDIERLNPRSINDVLEMSIPGIQLTMHGAQTRIRVQGMSAEHILFMLDGEPLNSEGNGAVDLNRIDIANIERIEIVRGAASALYGSNAIGGVINFITRNVHKRLSTSLSADYGTQGTQRYHGLLGLRLGQVTSQTTLNHNRQRSYTLSTEGEPFEVKGGTIWNASEKVRFTTKDRKWDASAYIYGSLRTQDWDDKKKDDYRSYDIGSRINYRPSVRHSAFASYNLSTYRHSTYFYTAARDQYLPLFDLYTGRARAQYNFGQEGRDRILLNAGLDAVWESVTGDRIVSSGETFSSSTLALYGQAEWRISTALSATMGFREDIHSAFGSHFTPRLTLLFRQPSWRIRASYSEGFRSPSTKELHMDWDHNGMFRIKGNPKLEPETSRMISLAPEVQIGTELNLTIQASYNRIRGKIFNRVEENGQVRRFYNAPDLTELWQTQASLRWQIARNVRLNLDYAYIREVLKVQTKAGESISASTVRPHNITASLTYLRQWRNWGLSLDASSRFSSATTTALFDSQVQDYKAVRYESFNIVRLGASAHWRHRLKGTIGVDNLFDFRARHINESASLSPGTTLFASLAVHI